MKITMQYTRYKVVEVMEEKTPYNREVSSPEAVCRIFGDIWGDPVQELFVVFLVNSKNKIVSVEMVSKGTLTQTIIHPRDIFRAAVTKNANAIIIAHNHPSGGTSPSYEDCEVTKRMVEAGKVIGIPVLDHVIVAGEEVYSFQREGRI